MRIARVGTVAAVALAILSLAGNVFTRNALGYSLFGAEELARFAFLWAIWLGVSLGVKRGAVTVITFVADAGPAWWQRSVRTFSGVSLAVLLLYACWRSTEYATGQFATTGSSPSLEISWFYPVVSMTVGYYFITLHYAAAVTAGRGPPRGRGPARRWAGPLGAPRRRPPPSGPSSGGWPPCCWRSARPSWSRWG